VTAVLAVGAPPLLADLAVVVVAAALAGYVSQRVGLVAIVGYVLAGVAVGPRALGLVDDDVLVAQMAEVGVVFLMFSIGLELSQDMLRRTGAMMFLGGGLQVGLTVGLVVVVCLALGASVEDGIFTGCIVALSSTAVVLKLLSASGETSSPTGEVAVALLVFQDLAVVLMVVLVPMLGGADGGLRDILIEGGQATLVVVAVLTLTRNLVPRVLGAVTSRTDGEEFLFAILALAVGVAYLVTLLGLTASLGAFVAGLVVSAGPHRERALQYVMPFQIVFVAVFFASVGMLLDPRFVLEHVSEVAVLALGVVVLKALVIAAVVRVLRRPSSVSVESALLLSQIGEFSFVLATVGTVAGLAVAGQADGTQLFVAVAVVLIALTPLLQSVGRRLAGRLATAGSR
jgi:CPA2 family monovalent cation:H+ antiporter-2